MKIARAIFCLLAASTPLVSSRPAALPRLSSIFGLNPHLGHHATVPAFNISQTSFLDNSTHAGILNVTHRSVNSTRIGGDGLSDGGKIGKALQSMLEEETDRNGALKLLTGLLARVEQRATKMDDRSPVNHGSGLVKPQVEANGDGHADESLHSGVDNIERKQSNNGDPKMKTALR